MSPETYDTSATTPNDVNSSNKIVLARTTKIVTSVSALIVGAIIYGVTILERMLTILRLKEGLDRLYRFRLLQFAANKPKITARFKDSEAINCHRQDHRIAAVELFKGSTRLDRRYDPSA
ncbi:unnamed protein product [Vicia faba]|uniref:Uncharacterized protein n=1 Tax=Vicia faba TaxID=3906 RepID=A0AAV1AC13_VICFA|nr:unnamed protein product [Vicia faba]